MFLLVFLVISYEIQKKLSSLQEQYSSLGETDSDNLGVCLHRNCRAFHRARGKTVEKIAANYPLQQSL